MTNEYHTSPLVGSLYLYTDAIVLHRPDGATHCVDPLDVGAALSALRLGTPLLPRNTLFWQRGGGRERIGVYVEPAVHPMWVKVNSETWSAKVPMPGCLFVGQGTRYHIWALRGGWPAADSRLYAMPCPNVGGDGLICNGDVDFPDAGVGTIWAAVEAFFFGSVFAGHSVQRKSRKFRDDVLAGWREMAGAAAWPEKDLVEAGGTVGEVVDGPR